MNDDQRCCGSGTCIINSEGRCWCGQQWNGEAMVHTPLAPLAPLAQPAPPAQPASTPKRLSDSISSIE